MSDSENSVMSSSTSDVYAEYKKKVDRMAPHLLETRWFPMTYMMIPSLLRDADLLIQEMEKADAGPDQKNLEALLTKLKYLRSSFGRITRTE